MWRHSIALVSTALFSPWLPGNTQEAPRQSPQPSIRAVTHGPKFHWFGYYDVQQFDPGGRYLLSCEVDFEHRSPRPDDVIRIGSIDLHDGDRWTELGTSRAWCWQQGCRLQWRPGSHHEVLWNDREEGRFVCRILDTRTGRMRTLPKPIYHVSPDGRWALGTDFARIQDMRPGYGYAGIPDPNRDVLAPKDSGIYKLDLDTGESTFLFSIADIAAMPYPGAQAGDKHYFNHIEWNPDGSRFLFLHRWRSKGGGGFKTRMLTADASGREIRVVTDQPAISHYTWRDPGHILVHRGVYRLYADDGSGRETTVLEAPNGHQSYLPGGEWLLTDTYPSGPERIQELYLFHLPTRTKVTVGRFPSPPEYRGEWRVDTHPRLDPSGTKVVIDSAHGGNGRQLYLIDIAELLVPPPPGERTRDDVSRDEAALWIEAESALPGPGLEIDRRKASTANEGLALGVHCDDQPEVSCAWLLEANGELSQPTIALRHATPDGARFEVRLDRRPLGVAALSTTPGWGYRAVDWQWARFALGVPLPAGPHLLELRAASSRNVNLDTLAILDDSNAAELEPLQPAAPAIAVPVWRVPDDVTATPVVLGAEQGRFRAWGRRGNEPRQFFAEHLPALFERTLEFEGLAAGQRLQWIITGPHGGVTVDIRAGELRLQQRYYDSKAFDAIAGRAERHPEWRPDAEVVRLDGELRAVTVTLDHALGLKLAVNGETALQQICLFDLSRHQLWLHGEGTAVRGRMLRPTASTARIRVHPDRTHQRMIGFGGIATPTAYAQLGDAGKRRYWRQLCEYNLLIQREYPIGTQLTEAMDNWDRLEDATPHYYGDNFPNGEISDFAYQRTLRRLGGAVWFEFWALPPWVKDDPETYARAMLGYCHTSKEMTGLPPDVVGIQNEVDQPAVRFQRMTLALREALDREGFEAVRIHMSDASTLRDGLARIAKFRADPATWAAVDYAATHMYDYQGSFTDPDAYDQQLQRWRQLAGDKPFLSTELCVNDSRYQWSTYRIALAMGQLYHKNLVLANAAALCYCWMLLNVQQPSYGATRSLLVVDPASGFESVPSSHQLRVFGAYSRRVRAGMQRVETECDDPDLLVAAFRDTNGRATLIALNRSSHPVQMNLVWPEVDFTQLELTSPYHPNVAEPYSQGVSTTLPPGAIATLSSVPIREVPDGFTVDR